MNKRLAWLVLVIYLLLMTCASAQPQIPPAPTQGVYVQDHAGVLDSDTKSKINNLGGKLAAKTKAQIVVLTVKSLEGASLDEYALEVLRRWGIGDKQLNNGVLVLVAVNDRQSRIEVGYGLEGVLNDAKTGAIQDEYMIPYFAANDYNKGIWNGYQALVSTTAKEYQLDISTDAKSAKVRSAANQSWWDTLPWWAQLAMAAGALALLIFDWVFLGGSITYLILSLLRFRGGGGGGGGGYGGGSGGGGGSSRKW
ncbi:TPM domain-containing protein [Sporomusa sp.]|uniref:TPM domain-containing protein n=1 Tax=Sporomusa sp. TaxID=2078658 RepID=UPI002CD6417B|nr:TPM domain-containing protein [Sporomusa sp.]HWR43188.1 TPM domain-containing protein [Sporomusa sp.]